MPILYCLVLFNAPSIPCSVCNKNVLGNSIFCDHCKYWVHKKCNKLSNIEFETLISENENTRFCCILCERKGLPFWSIPDIDFKTLTITGVILDTNILDKSEIKMIESQDYIAKLNNHLSNAVLPSDEESDDNVSPVNCNYYSLEEFSEAKFDKSKTFSIFHLNIHSIEKHLDSLKCLLLMINFNFDILTISESKLLLDSPSQIDLTIEGYQSPVSVPTEAMKGGVLLYVREGIDFNPRADLHIYAPKSIESCFIEIINPGNVANDIVGVLYRHPSTIEPKDFNENYLKILLDKLAKENKDIYLTGDFNFDLIKGSIHPDTSEFIDIMTSYYLLPTISLPTKINKKHDTLIDNIFTSKFNPDIVSGNLTTEISDHLPSFTIFPKSNQNHLPKKQLFQMRYKKI